MNYAITTFITIMQQPVEANRELKASVKAGEFQPQGFCIVHITAHTSFFDLSCNVNDYFKKSDV